MFHLIDLHFRNIPLARPCTELTTLPNLDAPNTTKYEWSRPMPPPPPRRSRMELPVIRTEHDRYCQYYKIAKQKGEEQVGVIKSMCYQI
jgi:hypothetical protein